MNNDPYHSRVDTEEELLPRVDPVVFSDYKNSKTENTLATPEVLDFYEKNGFALFPELFKEMIPQMQDELERLQDQLGETDEVIREPDNHRIRSLFMVQKFSPLFDKISRDPRILSLVSTILGSQVYLHQTRINIKPAHKGKSFPWHSDFETWHVEDGMPRMRALTAWIMMNDNNEFNGPLYVIPGSHKTYVKCSGQTPENHYQESLRKQQYGSPSTDALKTLADQSGLQGVYGKAGTLVIHESNIMHGSPDNISVWPRTNLFFVYNSVENIPAEKPFGTDEFRPDFLGNRDYTPLQPGKTGS